MTHIHVCAAQVAGWVTLALLVVIAAVACSGCTAPMQCSASYSRKVHTVVEVCSRRVCRDLETGLLIDCPEEGR